MANTTEDNVRDSMAFGLDSMVDALADLVKKKDDRIAVLEKDHVWRLTVAENQDRIIQDNIARIAALESELSTTKSILESTQAALRRASVDVTL